MYVDPKQSLQSDPPLSQKSVEVMLEPEVEELSRPDEGAGLSELDDGVVPLESDPDDEQLSIPDLLSPGM
jgi:hypothetical protein